MDLEVEQRQRRHPAGDLVPAVRAGQLKDPVAAPRQPGDDGGPGHLPGKRAQLHVLRVEHALHLPVDAVLDLLHEARAAIRPPCAVASEIVRVPLLEVARADAQDGRAERILARDEVEALGTPRLVFAQQFEGLTVLCGHPRRVTAARRGATVRRHAGPPDAGRWSRQMRAALSSIRACAVASRNGRTSGQCAARR